MLSELQCKLLEMLSWFHDYCQKNNITYYAAGGTVLGAVRHNGFIPWDDDVDVVVPREDYNRLLKLFNKQEDHYFLETPYSINDDYLYSYSKLYDTDTTLTEKTQVTCKRGVYIDVFPLDGVGNTLEEAKKALSIIDRKRNLLLSRNCVVRSERRWYKNLAITILHYVPSFLINNKKLAVEVDQKANEINDGNAVYVANPMGTYRSKEIVKREVFGTPVLHKFESIDIYIPERYKDYLAHIYGRWEELPPVEIRKTQHDFIEIDLHKSYLL